MRGRLLSPRPGPLQVTPAALVDLWKNKFLLRVATKMTLGNTLGSAVLDVLNNTATLEVEVPSAGPGTAGDGGGNGGGGGGGGGGGVRRNNSAKSQEERQARTAC